MSKTKLKNAPLKEVIFELHWDGSIVDPGIPVDDGFDLAQGKLAEKLKPDYPLHKKLIPETAKLLVYGVPHHQYWKGEFKWPVIQHGQGILAVNEVGVTYEWEGIFKPTILKAVESLIDSYEKSPVFNRAKLQYIDAWDLDGMDVIDFMSKNLLTRVETQYPLPGSYKNINIFQSFELPDGSEMQLSIVNGFNNQNQKPSIIWTTTVEKIHVFQHSEINEWIDIAHKATSDMFIKMLEPTFYGSLDR